MLAQVHIHRGEFEEALAFLERALDLRRTDFGEESAAVAASLAGISYVRLLLYQPREAEIEAGRALEIFDRQGDEGPENRLLELVYQELHQQADRYLSRERPDHTLEPRALVHARAAPSPATGRWPGPGW